MFIYNIMIGAVRKIIRKYRKLKNKNTKKLIFFYSSLFLEQEQVLLDRCSISVARRCPGQRDLFFLFSFINGAIEIKFKFESNGLEIINQYHEIFELLKYILKIQTLPPVQYAHARPNMAIFRNKTYQIYLIGSIVG